MTRLCLLFCFLCTAPSAQAQVATPREAFLAFKELFEIYTGVYADGHEQLTISQVIQVNRANTSDFDYCTPSIRATTTNGASLAEYSINFTNFSYGVTGNLFATWSNLFYADGSHPVDFARIRPSNTFDGGHAGVLFHGTNADQVNYRLYADAESLGTAAIIATMTRYAAACDGVQP